MALAKLRHACFLPGRVVPLFFESRAPLKNAFAAVAARATPPNGVPCCRMIPLLASALRNSMPSALIPSAVAALPVLSTASFFACSFLCSLVLLLIMTTAAVAPKSES